MVGFIPRAKVNSLFLLETGQQPFAGFGKAGLAGVTCHTFERVARRSEIAADEAAGTVFVDGSHDASAAGGCIGPGQGLIGNLGQIGRRDGVSDGRVIGLRCIVWLVGNGSG